jgi:hypothetical protein
MNKPAQIWTDEKLLEAAIGELLAHGGNEADIAILRAEFQKANKDNKRIQSEQLEITDCIPS